MARFVFVVFFLRDVETSYSNGWRHKKAASGAARREIRSFNQANIQSVKEFEGKRAMRAHSALSGHPRDLVRGAIFKHIP